MGFHLFSKVSQIWHGRVFGLVWFGLVWLGLVWFGLVLVVHGRLLMNVGRVFHFVALDTVLCSQSWSELFV